MSAPHLFVTALLLASQLSPGLGSDEPLAARYRGGTVTRTELFLECARRLHNRPIGNEALENIIWCELVRQEAGSRSVTASDDEVGSRLRQMREDMKKAGRSLEKHLAEKGIGEREFGDYVRLLIQHEKMVMADLGLTDRDKASLSPQQMELWLRDMQRKRGVDRDPKLRHSGVAAVVGPKSLTMRDLGESIARAIDQEERKRMVRQIVGIELVDEEAKKEGMAATGEDLDGALAERRKEVQADPRYQKSSYEQILEAQGTSLAEVRNGPVLRAQVLIEKIVAKRYPPAALDQLYEQDRQKYDRKFGATRRVLDLLVKAAEGKPRFTTRTWEDARRECEKLAEKIQGEQAFLRTARIWSEDMAFKGRGGDRGFVHQDQDGVDPALTETAFALPLGKLSEPVRAADGYHLLLAVDERPAPPKERILERVREDVSMQFLNRLVDAAEIEYLEQ